MGTTLGFFAWLALALATIRIYGIVSYGVAQRTHEIGVRMALGAQRSEVRWLILRDGLKLLLIGCLVGFITAPPLPVVLANALYEFRVAPFSIYLIAPAVIAAVALWHATSPRGARCVSLPWLSCDRNSITRK